MCEIKYVPIGHTINVGFVKLKCVEVGPLIFCKGCWFHNRNMAIACNTIAGPCSRIFRPDNKSVVFIEEK